MHSTRGELFGILSCIRHISYLKSKYNIGLRNKIQVFLYTDSDSSIQIATNKFFLTSKTALDNDSDIKAEVRKIYKKHSKCISLQFVRSHQDEDKPFKSLSLASKLNVLMDKYAKSSLDPNAKPCIRNKSMIPHLPSQKVSFRNDFFRLTRNTLHNLNIYRVGHNAERHIQRKRSFNLSNGMISTEF